MTSFATHIGDVPIPKDSHAKIVFYSRGEPDSNNLTRYPFNVEMNINHEYWHLRENDPGTPDDPPDNSSASRVEIKFSFGNCLDDGNELKPAPPYGYVPEIAFKNLKWTDHLARSRLPALAGWQKTDREIFGVLNEVTYRVFSQFRGYGSQLRPEHEYGRNDKGFGLGTVHHSVGTLRMPYRPSYDGQGKSESVVDEDLRVVGTQHLYVCDMSVMPFSSAANPCARWPRSPFDYRSTSDSFENRLILRTSQSSVLCAKPIHQIEIIRHLPLTLDDPAVLLRSFITPSDDFLSNRVDLKKGATATATPTPEFLFEIAVGKLS